MSRKILAQITSVATTEKPLYIVPIYTETETTLLSITNMSGGTSSFRVRVLKAGDTLSNRNYLFYNLSILNGETVGYDESLTLSQGDSIFVYSDSNSINFMLFGKEFSTTI